MKTLTQTMVLVATLTLASLSYGKDLSNSDKMIIVLKKAGIEQNGHYDVQNASIECQVAQSSRDGKPSCDVKNERNDQVKTFSGAQGEKIANLLKAFGIEPAYRELQAATVECHWDAYETQEMVCDVQDNLDLL